MIEMKDHAVQDLLNARTISEVSLNKDASMVAFTVSGAYKEMNGEDIKEVFLEELKRRKNKVFSFKKWSNFWPRFDPAGKRLAYLSKKGEDYRLTVYDIKSSRSEEIVIEGTAEGFEWISDDTIVMLIKDLDPLEEEKKSGEDGFFFEERPRFSSLWKYQLGSGFQRITRGIQIWEFSITGNRIAAITSDAPYEWSWYESKVSIVEADTGKVKSIYIPNNRQLAKPHISPDGSRLIFLESLWSDRTVAAGDIMLADLKTHKISNLTEGHNKSYSEISWRTPMEFYALANEEGTFIFTLFQGDKKKKLWSRYGAVNLPRSPSYSISGKILALSFESSKQRNELLVVDLSTGKEKIMSEVNSQLKRLKSYPTEKVTWKSNDGTQIYGIFRSAGKGSPLMVIVHGGPTASSSDQFIGHATLFLSRGYSIFLPNYRGSTGKGREFAEKNLGDMGGKDLGDILSGIDFLIKNRGVDGKRVFISGGSYGGFMSAWAITQTDIFKGAIALFGISDWISFHGTSNLSLWDRIHYDEDPYKFSRFTSFSPIRYVDRVKTPILLVHGTEDPFVPVGQFHQFYRALKDNGKEVRLLLFPREGHGFKEIKHQQQYFEEVLSWLKSHTLPNPV